MATDKKNGFDLLRLVLALCVLITHGIVLGGYKLLDPLEYLSKNQTNLGELSVMGFFTLSGYLITASFVNRRSILQFFSHRLFRIVPGFLVSLFITGFVLAPLIFVLAGRSISSFHFLGPESSTSYFVRNMFFVVRQWSIGNLLDYSAYKGCLNGSLWSLYPEVQCYFFTIIAGISGLFSKNRTILLIIAVITWTFFAINFNFSRNFGPTILILSPALKLYASYVAGTVAYVYRDKTSFDIKGTVFLGLFTLMLIKFGGYNISSPLLIALVLINAFQLFHCKFKHDVSYGVYIYGFPIQHVVYGFFAGSLNVVTFLALSALITLAFGFMSFIWVEKPFIQLRQKVDVLLARRSLLR